MVEEKFMVEEKIIGFFGAKLKKEMSLIVLKDVVVFPRIALHLIIQRPQSLKALDFAMQHDRMAVFVAQKKKTKKK